MNDFNYYNKSSPERKGKQYQTAEECLKENGDHVWSESFDPNAGMSCLVNHYGNSCSWHTPTKICYHCPAESRLETIQEEKKEWKIIDPPTP